MFSTKIRQGEEQEVELKQGETYSKVGEALATSILPRKRATTTNGRRPFIFSPPKKRVPFSCRWEGMMVRRSRSRECEKQLAVLVLLVFSTRLSSRGRLRGKRKGRRKEE